MGNKIANISRLLADGYYEKLFYEAAGQRPEIPMVRLPWPTENTEIKLPTGVKMDKKSDTNIKDLHITRRAKNAFYKMGQKMGYDPPFENLSVGDFSDVPIEDFLKIKEVGEGTANEINQVFNQLEDGQ